MNTQREGIKYPDVVSWAGGVEFCRGVERVSCRQAGRGDWGLSKAKVTSSKVALVAREGPLAAVADGSPTPHLCLPVALAKTAQRKTGAASLVYFPYKPGSSPSLTNARLRATFSGITPTTL